MTNHTFHPGGKGQDHDGGPSSWSHLGGAGRLEGAVIADGHSGAAARRVAAAEADETGHPVPVPGVGSEQIEAVLAEISAINTELLARRELE